MSSEAIKKPRKYYVYGGKRLTVNKIAEMFGINHKRLHRKLIDVELETDITALVNDFANEPVPNGGKRSGAGRFGEAGETKPMRIPLIYESAVKAFMKNLNATKELKESSTSIRIRNPFGELIDVDIQSKKVTD